MVSANKSLRRLDAVIERAIADQRIVGACVILLENGAVCYERAAGMADREAGVAMTMNTIFRLASVTKPIASTAVMVLVELGKISLDDPVARFLPDFRPRYADGTAPDLLIRHLLTHSAGLTYRFLEPAESNYNRLSVSDGLDQPGLSMRENLSRLAGTQLVFQPGRGWRYSLSIDVLGAVIEVVTGQTLGESIRELVTGPLGMSDTGFGISPGAQLAKQYVDGNPQPKPLEESTILPLTLPLIEAQIRVDPNRVFNPASFPSAGAGMVGTARDVAKLVTTICKGGAPILSAPTVAEMFRDQVGAQAETQGPGWGFGIGGAILSEKSRADTPQSAGTMTWTGVYGHYWFIDPVAGVALVSLTNTSWEGMNGAFPLALRDAAYAQ